MRTLKGVTALALVATFAAACSGGAATPAPSAAATTAPAESAAATEAPSAAPTEAPSAAVAACAPASLQTKTAGKLTIGADNPAFPPYYQPSDPATDPWELGDPTNRLGFEGRVAWTIARNLGFVGDTVTWVVAPFNNAIGPGEKDFDIYLTQVSYSAERAQAVDLSDGYYDVAQAVVAAKDSPLSKVTSIAALKDFQFGAQVGTTSLETINTTIAPAKEAKVYDTNDLAVEALKNGQIDGLVVDLPTGFYIIGGGQFPDGVIAGQFPPKEGGEHFSVVLDLGSSLTACVNSAIGQMRDSGELARITQEELSDNAGAPVYQP
ncbi:MAG TPA: ABC transporter substrate-binding protein [Candidatus Limnocylindrales bacterium]|nr:ABC transporter substrate-binding protein [Candidatus Limnocylindrales bacterium]